MAEPTAERPPDALAGRFAGCLLGCAIGDALGMPTEGMSPREIQARYGRLTDFHPSPTGGVVGPEGPIGVQGGMGLAAGQYTDDTQMMLCLAEQIAQDGQFSPEATARRFVRWYYAQPRRPGRACIDACHRLIEGVPWSESGGQGEAGSGAAMRVMPIGLRYFRDLAALKRGAAESAIITHRDSRAIAGAVAIAYAVALALGAGVDLQGGVFLGQVADFAADMDERVVPAIAQAQRLLADDPEEALTKLGTGGSVMEAVPAALYCFARSPGDFEGTVLRAANAGGDTDTIGAMAGAISGALNGVNSLPARFRDHVEGADHLRQVALKLYRHTTGSASASAER